MTNFVTGATGLIGSHLCKTLIESDEEVVALAHDYKPSKWIREALKGCIIVRGNLKDYRFLERVIAQYQIQSVFHLGALAKVKIAFKTPINVYETNVMGTVNVLEACRQVGVDRTLVMVTDKVYGEKLDATVGDPIKASEPYATSKACSRLIAESYRKTYDMSVSSVHSCNVYGLDYGNRIIPNTIRDCLKGLNPIIFKDEEQSVRQYIHVFDIVDALHKIMNKTYLHPFYNICSEKLYNQEDIVLKILGFFDGLKPRYCERKRIKEISRQSMILSRNIDWKPQVSLNAGIKDTIEMFRKYGG